MAQIKDIYTYGCNHQYQYRDPSCNCNRNYCDRRRKRKCVRRGCKHWIPKSEDWKPRNEAEFYEERELRANEARESTEE